MEANKRYPSQWIALALATAAIFMAAVAFRWTDPVYAGENTVVYIDRWTGDVWMSTHGKSIPAKWKVTFDATEAYEVKQQPPK